MLEYVVIIDDSETKRNSIKEYINAIDNTLKISEFDCVNKGLNFVGRVNREDIRSYPNKWLIITDMVMPCMNGTPLIADGGMRVLRELKRLKFNCPVIVESSLELDYNKCVGTYANVIGVVTESGSVYNLDQYKRLIQEYI